MRALAAVAVALLAAADGCDGPSPALAASGVQPTTVKVPVGSDGLSTEQRNIRDRLVEDNKPGSVKHLYVLSAYSGQVLIYSTVRGKVTSSGKRLTPKTVAATNGQYIGEPHEGFSVGFNGQEKRTGEVLQDDGSYGDSTDYLYWWDTKGVYHQHYVSGGQILHVSSQPIAVKSIVLNLSTEAG